MRVGTWSWRCKSSISYYFTFALRNRWQPIAINLRCILHDNSEAPLGQPVCIYRSSVVFCGCGNWVVYIVWAFVSVLLINCCWLVINFKSWSKNANCFEQSIFTTDTHTWQHSGWDSNPRPLEHESNALKTSPTFNKNSGYRLQSIQHKLESKHVNKSR